MSIHCILMLKMGDSIKMYFFTDLLLFQKYSQIYTFVDPVWERVCVYMCVSERQRESDRESLVGNIFKEEHFSFILKSVYRSCDSWSVSKLWQNNIKQRQMFVQCSIAACLLSLWAGTLF